MEPLRDADPRWAGRYRLVARLGGGGMGEVYLGASPGGMTVAVKIVRPHLLVGDPSFRQRFAREVAAAGRVGGFYTAQVVDADTDAEQPWLATAYIAGPSLFDAVRGRGEPLPEQAVRVLGAGLAEGLAAIHRCGVIHRDLTPRNVILADGGPRIIDFGIARALDAAPQHPASALLGTPEYMSPEQAKGRTTAPSGDVFSLGSVLTFAATGHSPFAAESPLAALHRVIEDAPDLGDLPAGLVAVVSACLAKSPDARPDLDDVLRRLASPAEAVTEWLPRDVTDMVSGHRTRTKEVLHATRPYTEAAKPPPEQPKPEPPPPHPDAVPVAPKPAAPEPKPRLKSEPKPAAPKPKPKPKQAAPKPKPAAPKPAVSPRTPATNPASASASTTKPSTPAKADASSASSSDDSGNETAKFIALAVAVLLGIGFLHYYVGGAREAKVGDCVYIWNNRVWNKEPCKHPIIGELSYVVTGRYTWYGALGSCPPFTDRTAFFGPTKQKAGVTLCLRQLKKK